MNHHTHYDGSRASHTQQQAASQSASSTGSSSGSASADSSSLRRVPFLRRLHRYGLVEETRPLVGLWILGGTGLGWLLYRTMGEHLRVRNADRALRTGADLDSAEEKQDQRASDDGKGGSGRSCGGGGGGGGESTAPSTAATFTPANQVADSTPLPTHASSGVTSNSRAVSAFSPLPSNHTTRYTQATIAETRVTTRDREIGTVEGADLWSAHDPAELEAVLSLVEPPISRTQTLHRAVLKLMAIERDLLPMISFPEYNFE